MVPSLEVFTQWGELVEGGNYTGDYFILFLRTERTGQ